MEVKRLDAEQSASEALSSENASETAQTAAETAQAASEAARDLSQTYANQAFQTTPTVIQQGIIISQLYGGLFNGSTLDA
jgi:FKBP-type peptidyl-prolyl cis-trans isomerase